MKHYKALKNFLGTETWYGVVWGLITAPIILSGVGLTWVGILLNSFSVDRANEFLRGL